MIFDSIFLCSRSALFPGCNTFDRDQACLTTRIHIFLRLVGKSEDKIIEDEQGQQQHLARSWNETQTLESKSSLKRKVPLNRVQWSMISQCKDFG
mmetsp:Transcript_86179/g.157134  ORF Transcript_86179/g.157134 Transcript_86179/m.157134 type:complete len:95 (+) Transcript_86179:428-712(+)